MRHETNYADGIVFSNECQACIGWAAHQNSFASNVSGSLADGIHVAVSGEFALPPELNASQFIRERYLDQRECFVSSFNGLFSGVLLDSRNESALLFLDRYGSERLYYRLEGELLFFASEAKALLAVLPETCSYDLDAVADFLAFGSVGGTKTLFKGISRLPGASLWAFRGGNINKRGRYFDPTEWESLPHLPAAEFECRFVETAKEVIPRYLDSATTVGVSITGGLDTRMIMACVPEGAANLICYTYGAESGETLDVRIGREISKLLGYSHEVLRINGTFLAEFHEYLDRTVFLSDGSATAVNAHELFFSELARELSPIRLTGNYGSEVFRRMSTLKPETYKKGFLDPDFALRVSEARQARVAEPSLTGTVFDEIPSHLFGPLATARSQLVFRTPFLDNELVELAYRAPASSLSSSAASLRLIAEGQDRLGQIPTDLGISCERWSPLAIARTVASKVTFKLDYWDKEGLGSGAAVFERVRPLFQRAGLLGHHKFLPYREWFKEEFREVVDSAARRASSGAQPWFNSVVVNELGALHSVGARNNLVEINALLTLDAIDRVLLQPAREKQELSVEA